MLLSQEGVFMWNVSKRVCTFSVFATASQVHCVYTCACVCVCVFSQGWATMHGAEASFFLNSWWRCLFETLFTCVCSSVSVCSFWVNWLKLPFSLRLSLFFFSLLSGHTLRRQIHPEQQRERQEWRKSSSFTWLCDMQHLVFLYFPFSPFLTMLY